MAVLRSTTGDDILKGTEFDDIARGDLGNDVIYGFAGADGLDGEEGDDILYGGRGNDILSTGRGHDTGSDKLYGGAGDDTLMGMGVHGSGYFNAGRGADYISTLGYDNTVIGGAGADEIRLLANVALHGTGRNVAMGGNGRDSILSDDGNDLLKGGAGDDRLDGRGGNDVLVGGRGADTFVFYPEFGHDKVRDFKPEQGDRLLLTLAVHDGGSMTGEELVEEYGVIRHGLVVKLDMEYDLEIVFGRDVDPDALAGAIDFLEF